MRALAALAGLLLLLALAPAPPAAAEPSSQGNGVLLMIHGTFHPRTSAMVFGATGVFVPPVQEAVGVTAVDGVVTFNVIPFSVGPGLPMLAYHPELVLLTPLGDELARLAPNGDAAQQTECAEETQLPGHEGPLAACLVFHVPAAGFTGREVLGLRLEFRVVPDTCVEVPAPGSGHGHGHGRGHDRPPRVECTPGPLMVEDYDVAQHYQIHASFEAPASLPLWDRAYADSLALPRTPFVVENLAST